MVVLLFAPVAPVTIPVEATTLAIAGAADNHEPPGNKLVNAMVF